MKIADLFSNPMLDEMQIIAGEAGLQREIMTVNMMDAPDIIPYLKPNELLVTTAYHMKDQPQSLRELVQAMVNKRCAGLGIKTKRYLGEIPRDIIKLADDLAFPLIELPDSVSLGDIVNKTLQVILDRRTNELTYAMEIHKQFTQLIMSGKGIDRLLAKLAEMIGCPIALINQQFKPLFYTSDSASLFPFFLSLQKEGFTFPSTNITNFLFSIMATKRTYSAFPVHMSERNIGFLIVAAEIREENNMKALIIEQATNVLSFALMKEHALKQFNRSVRNEFFHHFVEGTFSSETEIINRAKEFSLHHNQKFLCAVGRVDQHRINDSYKQQQQKTDLLFECIEEELLDAKVAIHYFTKGEKCILLLEREEFSADSAKFFGLVLQEIQKKMAFYFQMTISFGVSSPCQDLLYVPTAYKEATAALKDGRQLKKTSFIHEYRMKDIFELLRAVPQEDLKNFYRHTLRGFECLGEEEKQTLLQTLSVYLETQCQISETAKRLYVHRNTVVYRLEKCEDLIGEPIKDSETALRIRLALKIKSLLAGER
ncbi:MAG: PucR family transcriptional regulator [Bacillus sp. (in: firmicutes)]